MWRSKLKILAIGAHADDVEIGCGGMLLKHVAMGDEVCILTITDSEYKVPNNGHSRSAEIAKKEANKAAALIGAKLICLDKPSLNLLHNEQFSYEFDTIINEVKPDIVLTHWGSDFHSDHAAVSMSSLRAARHVNEILLYRSNWYSTESEFNGNYYVNISEYVEKKIEVIGCYKSVLEPVDYSWLDFIRIQNEYEGLKIGAKAAECFSCIKTIKW